ncbi:sarcosine oxidase subunit gamma [Hypericibacter sp.]|uniref:sarcosine oxidase subunit gamma n=1 Tax=Hypericibacter sp. TaxID=2705401 RepID=UPI003D6C7ED5
MLERRSALEKDLQQGGHEGAKGERGVALGEVRGWSLVQASGFPDQAASFEAALASQLGAGLPAKVGDGVSAQGRTIMRVGPEHFWIVGPEKDDLAARLSQAVAPTIGSILPLSHSRTRIFIEGASAREVLAKGIPLDFDPNVFKVGQFALTGLHHTPVLVHRSAADRYEIYAMRTFAHSIWEWFTDAALPVGYDVVR